MFENDFGGVFENDFGSVIGTTPGTQRRTGPGLVNGVVLERGIAALVRVRVRVLGGKTATKPENSRSNVGASLLRSTGGG